MGVVRKVGESELTILWRRRYQEGDLKCEVRYPIRGGRVGSGVGEGWLCVKVRRVQNKNVKLKLISVIRLKIGVPQNKPAEHS